MGKIACAAVALAVGAAVVVGGSGVASGAGSTCRDVLTEASVNSASCSVAGARLQLRSGLSVTVPAVGGSVFAERLLADGRFESALVSHEGQGRVVVSEGEAAHAAQESLAVAASACTDPTTAYSYITSRKWTSNLYWRYNGSGGPAGAVTAIQRGFNNINTLYNDCGRVGTIPGANQAVYAGTTATAPGINSGDATCSVNDGANVVGWGYLPSGILGVTCTWWNSTRITETDQRYSTRYSWWLSSSFVGCSGRWDLEGVATHETGHSFGMGHVSEATYPLQTMSTNLNGTCQGSERTLGRGDHVGLDLRY